MTEQPLTGQVALVTGASRGIGAAVAERLGGLGAHVILVARSAGGLEETDDKVRRVGGTATLVLLDLLEMDGIDHLGAALYERWGRLDILIGNAGMLGSIGPMAHCPIRDFQEVIDLNLTANWRLIRSFDALLRQSPRGRALFTTCAVGHIPTAYWSAYAIAKAGLEMMVKTYAEELHQTNLRVGLIDPGIVATKLRKQAFPGENPATIPQPDAVADRFIRAILDHS